MRKQIRCKPGIRGWNRKTGGLTFNNHVEAIGSVKVLPTCRKLAVLTVYWVDQEVQRPQKKRSTMRLLQSGVIKMEKYTIPSFIPSILPKKYEFNNYMQKYHHKRAVFQESCSTQIEHRNTERCILLQSRKNSCTQQLHPSPSSQSTRPPWPVNTV